jgi:hypothetical protein
MAITPNSTVYLCSTPLNKSSKNQLTFGSAAAQSTYFSGTMRHSYNGLRYVRKDNILNVPAHIDDINDCNYIMYKNTAYTSKWFYAYVDKMEYVSDTCTAVYMSTDAYQTWMFELTVLPSFVVREHVTDDTIGLHTIDEGLNVGEIVNDSAGNLLSGNTVLVVATTWDTTDHYGGQFAKNFSGYAHKVFSRTDLGGLQAWLIDVATAGKSDAIGFMFLAPVEAVPGYNSGDLFLSKDSVFDTQTLAIQYDTLNGYTPKNNKLYTHPYSFLYLTNNNGTAAIYKYEDFTAPIVAGEKSIEFSMVTGLVPGGCVSLTPLYYKGIHYNYDESIAMGDYPLCSWVTDFYSNWLAQNGFQNAVSIGSGILSTVVGGVTGNAVGVAGGLLSVAASIGNFVQADIQPNQAKGGGKSNINTARYSNFFTFIQKCAKAENLKVIDNFFEMYGYKVNDVKVPNITGRPYWNYIQTIDCNVKGGIPDGDLSEIKAMFDGGVTFWHNTAHFCDYSQDNH